LAARSSAALSSASIGTESCSRSFAEFAITKNPFKSSRYLGTQGHEVTLRDATMGRLGSRRNARCAAHRLAKKISRPGEVKLRLGDDWRIRPRIARGGIFWFLQNILISK
jgi:hypothetical protein